MEEASKPTGDDGGKGDKSRKVGTGVASISNFWTCYLSLVHITLPGKLP